MAAASATASGSSIPLNATLHATRYLGAKAPDKRKVCSLPPLSLLTSLDPRTTLLTSHPSLSRFVLQIRKQSDKKFVFDWDRSDDTGANEVDPMYAPIIPRAVASKSQGFGRNDRNDRNGGGGGGSQYGVKNDERKAEGTTVVLTGMKGQIGMYGRGMLAGFDRDVMPGRKG